MKTLNKLYIVATAALSLTACNSDDNYLDAFQGDPNAVRFSVSIADNSQAKLQTKVNTFDNTDPAFEDGDEVTVSAGDQKAVTYKLSGGSWVPGSSNYLIWKTETNLQFDAYYPATTDNNGASMETFTQPTEFKSVADLKAADYMTFSGEKDRVKGQPVALEMQRKMARVIFVVDKTNVLNQYKEFTASSITMKINSKGYKGGAVDLDEANLTTVTTYNMDNQGANFYALVSPTTPQSTAEFLTINGTADNNPVELKITGIPEMKAGNSYTYTLTIGKNVATVAKVTIAPWTNGGVIENGTGVAEEQTYPKVDAENHIIYTNAEGQLKNDEATAALITKALGDNGEYLKVVGPISSTDDKSYRKFVELVKNLDLSDAEITTLPESAFSPNITKVLETIVLPEKLHTIPQYCFSGCTTLTKITCKGAITEIDEDAFLALAKDVTLDLTANTDVAGFTSGVDDFSDVFSQDGYDGTTGSTYNRHYTVNVQSQEVRNKFLENSVWKEGVGGGYVTIVSQAYADAPTNTVYTFAEGQMTTELVTTAMGSTNTLKVVGPMNSADWEVIGNLHKTNSSISFDLLDLSEVTLDATLATGLSCDINLETLKKIKTLTLPANQTAIPDKAFYDCQMLEEVTINGNITSVGISAFEGDTSLKTVTFKGTVGSIGLNAFNFTNSNATPTIDLSNCKSLPTITADRSNGKTSFGNRTDLEKNSAYKKTVYIQSSLNESVDDNLNWSYVRCGASYPGRVVISYK